MFDGFPQYPRYRALRLTEPRIAGEDVYALQTALQKFSDPGSHDGVLGPKTAQALGDAQIVLHLTQDGVCGPKTWGTAVIALAKVSRDRYGIATGLLKGQLSHESGLYGGNYSPQRPDGSYDAGVAQRNTTYTPALVGFDVPTSIDALAANTKRYYEDFAGVSKRRRWGLAAGAWNAPAFACYIANEEGASVAKNRTAKPSDAARRTFEAYVSSVSAYL